MKNSGIYKIQSNIKPERTYIGSAVDFKNRWRTHINDLKRNKHHSKKLQYHFNKYGLLDLVFSIIEPCLPIFLTAIEDTYLHPLPYFNNCPVAGSNLGFKMSDETKLKMSDARKGEKNWNYGKHPSEETKQKLHISRKGNKNSVGRKYSKETIEKMKTASAERWKNPISEETRSKMSVSASLRKKRIEIINSLI